MIIILAPKTRAGINNTITFNIAAFSMLPAIGPCNEHPPPVFGTLFGVGVGIVLAGGADGPGVGIAVGVGGGVGVGPAASTD